MKTVLGIDLGTTWCKAALYNPQGEMVAFHRVSSRVGAPEMGAADADLAQWWTAVAAVAIPLAARTVPEAVALSCRGYNGLFLDGGMRAAPVADGVPNQHDPVVYQSAGWGAAGAWAAAYAPILVANLRWLRLERPSLHARVRRAGGLHNYLLWRLTGRWATDPCNGPGSALHWPDAARTLSGLPLTAFAEPLPFDAPAGGLTTEAAAELGLPTGLPVACGGHDGALANLGGDAWEPGTAMITLGTNAVVRIVVPGPIAGFFGYPVPGGAWAWVRGAHGTAAVVEAAGASGTQAHAAALGHVAERVRTLVAAAAEVGLHPPSYQVTGGLANVPQMVRLLEQALAVPLVPTDPQAGCRGAAVLAAVVAGWYSDVPAAARAMRFRTGRAG